MYVSYMTIHFSYMIKYVSYMIKCTSYKNVSGHKYMKFFFQGSKILSVSKKYLNFAISKWRSKCTKIRKFVIKIYFYRSLAVKCHIINSYHEKVNDNVKCYF